MSSYRARTILAGSSVALSAAVTDAGRGHRVIVFDPCRLSVDSADAARRLVTPASRSGPTVAAARRTGGGAQ